LVQGRGNDCGGSRGVTILHRLKNIGWEVEVNHLGGEGGGVEVGSGWLVLEVDGG
jgi:hypothetical protein